MKFTFLQFIELQTSKLKGAKMKSNFIKTKQKGQGLVEYIILVAIIAVASIGIVRTLGEVTSIQFANITQSLQGGNGSEIKTNPVNANLYKKKDLSDFTSNSRKGSGTWR